MDIQLGSQDVHDIVHVVLSFCFLVQRVLVEYVLNFMDHRFLNKKNLWILVIQENHKIKSTMDFLHIR